MTNTNLNNIELTNLLYANKSKNSFINISLQWLYKFYY